MIAKAGTPVRRFIPFLPTLALTLLRVSHNSIVIPRQQAHQHCNLCPSDYSKKPPKRVFLNNHSDEFTASRSRLAFHVAIPQDVIRLTIHA